MGAKKFVIAVCILLILATSSSAKATSDTASSVGVNEKNCTLEIDSELNVSVPNGSASNGFFNLSAVYPGNLWLNVTLTREGGIASWITFSGENSTNVSLSPGETRLMNLTVSAPASASLGLYFANITAESGDGQIKKLNLTVNVTQSVGRIRSFVNDTLGTPVEGATVFVWFDSYPKDSGSTNSSGLWLSSWLSPGNYTVEASKAGYITKVENVTVSGAMNVTNVTITLEPGGAPVLDVSPSAISASSYVGDIATKLLTIMNIGDMTLDDINISGPGWMSFSKDFISSLSQGSYENVEVSMVSSSVGTYEGDILVTSANDGNVTVHVTFDVSKKPAARGPSGPSGPLPVPPGKAAINITKYDKVVNVTAGEKKTFPVTVENSGNVTLSSIVLSIGGVDFDADVTPEIVRSLEPGRRSIFLVDLSVPAETSPGDYAALLTASAEQASDSKEFTIHVFEVGEEPEGVSDLLSEIENLEELADEVWREAVLAEMEGKNVTTVFDLLKEAKGSLRMARSYLESEQYEQTGGFIEDARNYIKGAVDELAKSSLILAECPVVDIRLLGICGIWWITTISVLIAVSLIYLIKLRRIRPYHYTPKRSVKADVEMIRKRLKRDKKS